MLNLVVRGRDPSAVAVLVEDGAAVAGLLIAASCLGLTSYTGNVVYDAVGSIAIGGTDSIHVPKCPIVSMQIVQYISRCLFKESVFPHLTHISTTITQQCTVMSFFWLQS